MSEEYASRSRLEIDLDEPSIDALQACLLLVVAFTAAGRGKKAYMLLSMALARLPFSRKLLTIVANAVGMAMAQELHREIDPRAGVTPVERETRRRLFWTCYLLDRFMACGSKRPCLVGDKTILLRLPCWSPNPAGLPIEGEFFHSGSPVQYLQGTGKKSQGSSGMLIDISRILGITNRYLAAGGVKGDSHFPWHTLSNLSKIRQDLDFWASGIEDVFSSLDTLFGQTDSTVLVLSKLVYHLIHCLIYRPFLPVDLAELAGNGQHQSWQIEATNMCFLHANAIAELVELGKQTATIEWPAFVGYCICTAGTVHIHGAHYSKTGPGGEMSVFSSSAEFLSREMQQLSELRYAWASVQHQRETLQSIYNAHTELVKSLANMRYSPVFQLEDFFDRYSNIGGPGGQSCSFDAANLSLADVVLDFTTDAYTGHDLYAPRGGDQERAHLKRKPTAQGGRRRTDSRAPAPLASNVNTHIHSGLPTPSHPRHISFPTPALQKQPPHPSPGMLHSPASLTSHQGMAEHHPRMNSMHDSEEMANNAAMAAAAAAGFAIPHHPHQPQPQVNPFSPPYTSYNPMPNSTPGHGPSSPLPGNHQKGNNTGGTSYDPMFGGLPTNAFSSPAAWQLNDGNPRAVGTQMVHSPGGMSANGSTGTASGEEKDPFLSLLEQLAENENARGPGSEFDMFFAGSSQQ